MYGCIIGKDGEGIWLLAEGFYAGLQLDIGILKKLETNMDIRLFEVDRETMENIRSNAVEIKSRFGPLFN